MLKQFRENVRFMIDAAVTTVAHTQIKQLQLQLLRCGSVAVAGVRERAFSSVASSRLNKWREH